MGTLHCKARLVLFGVLRLHQKVMSQTDPPPTITRDLQQRSRNIFQVLGGEHHHEKHCVTLAHPRVKGKFKSNRRVRGMIVNVSKYCNISQDIARLITFLAFVNCEGAIRLPRDYPSLNIHNEIIRVYGKIPQHLKGKKGVLLLRRILGDHRLGNVSKDVRQLMASGLTVFRFALQQR